MAETIRTFIAFGLPPEVAAMLQRVQQDLKQRKIRARWVRSDNIHLTLKFLGDIDPGAIEKVGAAMAAAAAGCPPIAVSVRGVGVFPGIKRPRVIWAGLGEDIRPLLDLRHRLEENLAAAGFPQDRKAFKAHLTLGRIKQAAEPVIIRQMLTEYAGLSSDEFAFNAAILFKSELKPSGAVHSVLKQVELGLTNDKC